MKTKLFEQHDGYFDLPHIDIKTIPVTDFPLYSHWSYDRIYRNDIIKQPDVLMFLFLYNQSFSLDIKKPIMNFMSLDVFMNHHYLLLFIQS